MKTQNPKQGVLIDGKNTHGGKRNGASPPRLPEGEHKKIIEIYLEQDYIDELGGKKILKDKIRGFVYGLLGIPYKGIK